MNIIGAINTAEEYRELKELQLLEPNLSKLTAFEFECYRIAEAAARTIEAEAVAETTANGGKGTPEKIGGALPEESAFSHWEK